MTFLRERGEVPTRECVCNSDFLGKFSGARREGTGLGLRIQKLKETLRPPSPPSSPSSSLPCRSPTQLTSRVGDWSGRLRGVGRVGIFLHGVCLAPSLEAGGWAGVGQVFDINGSPPGSYWRVNRNVTNLPTPSPPMTGRHEGGDPEVGVFKQGNRQYQ